MQNNLFTWTKNNKVATLIIFLLSIAVIFKGQGYVGTFNMTRTKSVYPGQEPVTFYPENGDTRQGMGGAPLDTKLSYIQPPISNVAPTDGVVDRKVITEGSASLQVKNVAETIKDLKTKVLALNGYVVNVYIDRPEFGENATASVRVPSEKVEELMAFVRSKAVKVVNENMSGSDLTDQYVDLETRLAQLTEQKAKLEAILRSAVTVQDIMAVQPYITQVQYEIDSVKGQTKYIDAASKMSLITLYFSTDELSLPYTPEKSWRPQAIFKNATRSLLGTVQLAGTGLIWLAVYSIVIVPALTVLLIIYFITKRRRN